MQKQRTKIGAAITAAALLGAGLAISAPSTALAAPVTVDFSSGTWDGGTGYPLDAAGGKGVSGAVGDLGAGMDVTVTYSEVGTAVAAGRDGSTLGNLNVLDGAAIPNLASPGSPLPAQCHTTEDFFGQVGTPANGCHETSGFALNIESNGANNSSYLDNYVRYDFVFSEPMTFPNGITVTDIDSLRVQYARNGFIPAYNADLYQDAVGFEFWTGAPGAPGSGTAPQMTLGADLSSSTLGGVSYVHSTVTPLGGRGGLTDSGNTANQVNFSASAPALGFSIYYWDSMLDSGAGNLATVFPSVGLENFDAEPLRGSLSLVKEVSSGDASPSAWTLVADGPTPVEGTTGTPEVTAVEVVPGTYTLSESGGPNGYVLDSLACVDGEQDAVTVNDENQISVAAGQDVTCTFTNSEVAPEAGSLSLVKEVSSGDASPSAWTLVADGPTPVEGTTGTPEVTAVEVVPGTYTLSESGGPNGYVLDSLACVDGEQDAVTVNDENQISVAAGQDVTCTFTNSAVAPEAGGNGSPATPSVALANTGSGFPVWPVLGGVLALILAGGVAVWVGTHRKETRTENLTQ